MHRYVETQAVEGPKGTNLYRRRVSRRSVCACARWGWPSGWRPCRSPHTCKAFPLCGFSCEPSGPRSGWRWRRTPRRCGAWARWTAAAHCLKVHCFLSGSHSCWLPLHPLVLGAGGVPVWPADLGAVLEVPDAAFSCVSYVYVLAATSPTPAKRPMTPAWTSPFLSDTDSNPILPCDLPLLCLAFGLGLPWRYHRKRAIFPYLCSVFTEITNNKHRTAEKHCQKSGEARETTLMAWLLAWACHGDNTRKRRSVHIFTQLLFKTTKIEILRNIASRLEKQGKQLYWLKDRKEKTNLAIGSIWLLFVYKYFGHSKHSPLICIQVFWPQQAFASYLYTSILATASIHLLFVYKYFGHSKHSPLICIQVFWPQQAFASYLYTSILATASIRLLFVYKYFGHSKHSPLICIQVFWSQQAFSSYLYTRILATASIRLLLLVYKYFGHSKHLALTCIQEFWPPQAFGSCYLYTSNLAPKCFVSTRHHLTTSKHHKSSVFGLWNYHSSPCPCMFTVTVC